MGAPSGHGHYADLAISFLLINHPPEIFEPFFSKQAGGQGTGLGLFICKSIISSWGGEIDVESRINQGTKFTLSFPAQP